MLILDVIFPKSYILLDERLLYKRSVGFIQYQYCRKRLKFGNEVILWIFIQVSSVIYSAPYFEHYILAYF